MGCRAVSDFHAPASAESRQRFVSPQNEDPFNERNKPIHTPRFLGIGINFALLLLLIAGFVRSGPSEAAQAQGQQPKNGKVQKLFKERLATLRQLAEQAIKDYEMAKVPFDRVHQVMRALLDAELELAKSDKDRLTVLEKIVALAKKYEEHAVHCYKLGTAPASEALLGKVGRLDAEIALERAKANLRAKRK